MVYTHDVTLKGFCTIFFRSVLPFRSVRNFRIRCFNVNVFVLDTFSSPVCKTRFVAYDAVNHETLLLPNHHHLKTDDS